MEVRGFISTIFPDLVFFGSYTLYDIIIYSVYAHLPELAFIRIALEGGEGDGHFTGKEFALFYKSLCFETSRSPEREVSSIKSHFVIKEIPAGVYFKAVVADILWKRIDAGMPLQLDSTVNYVTGKSDASVTIADTQKDSLYNTYMYKGLPKGPISNPGMNSITAALHPTKTAYWYYLSDGSTIYSKTDEEHAAARIKYLGH